MRIAARYITLFSVIVASLAPSATCRAQNADDYGPAELQAFFKDVVKQYEFEPDDLKLVDRPLMHWGNPVRTQVQGGLFVWTKEGVPAVLGSIFSFRKGAEIKYKHEMVTLLGQPIKASLNGRVVWAPTGADAKWKQLEAKEPAASAPRRLTQMRALAREFSGDKTDRAGLVTKLKILPQPLFRYESEKLGIVDGAIFGVVEATDPEMFIVIEAKSHNGAPAWRYSVLPSNWLALTLSRNSKVVWSKEIDRDLMSAFEGDPAHTSKAYFCFYCYAPLPPVTQLRELVEKQAKK